jgi:hypothetical protein
MPLSWEDQLRLNVNGPWWPPPPMWRQGYTDPGLPPGQVNPDTRPATQRAAVVGALGAAAGAATWNYSAGPEARAKALADLQKILARNVGGKKPRKRKSSKGMRRKVLQARGRTIADKLGRKIAGRSVLGPLGTVGAVLAGAATVYDIGKAVYSRVKIGERIVVLPSSGRTTGTGGRGGARRPQGGKKTPEKQHAEIVKTADKKVETAAPPAARPAPVTIPKKKTMAELVAEIKARPAPPPGKVAAAIYKYAPKAKELLLEFSKLRNKPKQPENRSFRPQEDESTAPLEFVQQATGMSPLTSFVGDRVASSDDKRCKCGPKKKRGKRKPRTTCYQGTFTETASGTRKLKRRKIPCRPSSARPR